MMDWITFIGASDEQVNWGGGNDPRTVLTIGETYEVERTSVHSWHTRIYLKGFDGWFNSVCFEAPDMTRPGNVIHET